jgi:hypothetical protein
LEVASDLLFVLAGAEECGFLEDGEEVDLEQGHDWVLLRGHQEAGRLQAAELGRRLFLLAAQDLYQSGNRRIRPISKSPIAYAFRSETDLRIAVIAVLRSPSSEMAYTKSSKGNSSSF